MSARPPAGVRDNSTQTRHEAEAKVQAIELARAQAQSAAMTGRIKMGFLAVAALLAAGWHRTFTEMWVRWFPAWGTPHLTLADRITEGDSYYTHGPLVGLTSLAIAFFIYRRVGLPRRNSPGATLVGAILLTVCVLLHLLSVSPSARVMFVSGFAFIGVLGALVLMWGGWPMARAYWLPIVFLVFMVPLPEVAIVDLNFRLKFIAGRTAMWLTHHLFGIPALLEGSYIHLPPDHTGQPKSLVIENVCSGLRSLISLVWFASLFALVCRLKGPWRLFMLVMAVPVAVACNVVRITALNIVAHYYSVQLAGPGSWFHDLSGLLVFAIALAILFGLEKVIMTLSRWLKREWVDLRLLGFLESVPRVHTAGRGRSLRVSLTVLAATAALSVYWSVYAWGVETNQLKTGAVPETITVDGAVFVSEDHDLDERSLIILEYPDYLFRTYTDPGTGQSVDLLIVFSANNRKGTHPPEVCIEGGGHIVTEKSLVRMVLPGTGDVALRELLTQRATAIGCFLYTYKCGSRYTPSFVAQQFWIFVNGLTAQDTSGALIRLSVSSNPQNVEPSRTLALQAAKVLLPHIDQGLR